MQREKPTQLQRRQLRSLSHAGTGCAEKPHHKSPAKRLDHQPRVNEIRIEAKLLRIKQRP